MGLGFSGDRVGLRG